MSDEPQAVVEEEAVTVEVPAPGTEEAPPPEAAAPEGDPKDAFIDKLMLIAKENLPFAETYRELEAQLRAIRGEPEEAEPETEEPKWASPEAQKAFEKSIEESNK